MHKSYFQNNFDDEDDIISSLVAHARPIDFPEDCYKKLVIKKDRFCFNSANLARYMIQKYRNPDKSAAMKIAQPVVVGDFLAHIYAPGSPYMKKFEVKFQQVFESGLHDSIFHRKQLFDANGKSNNQEISFEPINSINNQLIIFTIGCVISIFAFIFEIIYFMFKIRPYL